MMVEPKGPQNLGAVARLCENFGIEDWVIVRPRLDLTDPANLEQAEKFATGKSKRKLATLQVVDDLRAATEDCEISIAFCGRKTGKKSPTQVKIGDLTRAVLAQKSGKAALVFGSERYGLSVNDVSLCSRTVCLSTEADFPSMNLGHSIAAVLSRFHQDATDSLHLASKSSVAVVGPGESAVSQADYRAMLDHGKKTLLRLGYTKAGNPDRLLATFRQVFDRAQLRANEVRAFRSVFARIGHQEFPEGKGNVRPSSEATGHEEFPEGKGNVRPSSEAIAREEFPRSGKGIRAL
ncbi:MAG: RNA methyltransferase [Bdellovibrionales bacterium]|nr:RNA methyltransferase [Bdellovibrionales bacterium]